MSHFSVLVIGPNVDKQLAPYHEFECTGVNDEFIQEVDLTSDFRLRGIRFEDGIGEDDAENDVGFDDEAHHWKHEAGIQVLLLVSVIESLCTLFDYQKPTEPVSEPSAEADVRT